MLRVRLVTMGSGASFHLTALGTFAVRALYRMSVESAAVVVMWFGAEGVAPDSGGFEIAMLVDAV